MKKVIYLLLLTASIGFTSCSDDEDTTPSYTDINGFAPTDTDNSAEAQLRRQFQKQTGSYLLFTDTLSRKQVSTDAFGKPVYDVELVDVNYVMMGSSSSSRRLTYKYITDNDRKEKAAALLSSKFCSKLGNLTPFSFLVVDSISQWTQDDNMNYILYKKAPHPQYILGARCYAVSLNGDAAFEQDGYFDTMFQGVLYSLLKNKSKELSDYWSPVQTLLDKDKEDAGYEYGRNLDQAHSLGFLTTAYYYFPTAEKDLTAYINAVCTYSVADFETEYSDCPICISRFNVLRNYLLSKGVKLDK